MKQRNRFLAILTVLCCLGSMGSTAVLAQTTTETEPNNTMETAMPIALNTPVSADFRAIYSALQRCCRCWGRCCT